MILATFLLDQASKAAVQLWLYQGESIAVAPHFFYLTYILNPGAAFGLMAYQTPLLVAVTVIMLAGVAVGYRHIRTGSPILRYGLSLIVGGALGNLADRLRYGQVVDFLDFRVWPVFNLADTAIVIGAGLLVLELVKDRPKEPEKESGM
ncbi:MAG: signal peptidase II [Desulfotomaculaceae bacterium]|nr:signal peptidase II [Desulfotomaculaceae bacterium]